MEAGDSPTTRPSKKTRCPPADAAVKISPNPAAAASRSLPAGLATRADALTGEDASDDGMAEEAEAAGPPAEGLSGAATAATEVWTGSGAEATGAGNVDGAGAGTLAETNADRLPSWDQR